MNTTEREDFLETQAGQDWLDESVDTLMNWRIIEAPSVVGPSKVLVHPNRLVNALADHMSARIDPGCCIERILIVLLTGNQIVDAKQLAIRAIGGVDVVKDMARSLIAEHANEYRDAMLECDRVERECGF